MKKSETSAAYLDKSEQKKVLITGAGGYIGSVLTKEALKAGWKVIALDVCFGDSSGILSLCGNDNLLAKKKDILQLTKEDVDGVDIVFHLASIVGTPACEKNPKKAKKVNLEGTEKLLELARGAQIIYTNTNIGYPQGKSDETATLTPAGIYSETKIEAEKLILDNGGISLRLASVCGVSPKMRDDLLLNFLVKQCVKYDIIEVFDVYSSRNFIHVSDVVGGMVYHHEKLHRGEAYNLAISTHYTKLELLEIIQKELGKELSLKISEKEDPDKRDYHLSVKKWYQHTQSYPKITIKEAIKELISHYAFRAL